MIDPSRIQDAARAIKGSAFTIAFTGAGISVESGIPPFRGAQGIWSKYDPKVLDIDYFLANPSASWKVIKELFYHFFVDARSNMAHYALAHLEDKGFLNGIITQNIDNLHQQAGSKVVYEFHGNSQRLICLKCGNYYTPSDIDFDELPPFCACAGLIKPDFIFFGEGIPTGAYQNSVEAVSMAEVVVIIGSTGEVMPAAQMPFLASQNGATIIEVNPEKSNFTRAVTDIYLEGMAGEIMGLLYHEVTGEKLINT